MEPTHSLYDLTKDILIPVFGGLLSFAAFCIALKSLRDNTRVARANFEFQMTLSHRDTWRRIGELQLERIKDPSATTEQISEMELLNTNFVLINVANTYEAMKKGVLEKGRKKELFMKDVGEFFSLPIPAKIWEQMNRFYDKDFHKFISCCKILHQTGQLPPGKLYKIISKIRSEITIQIEIFQLYYSSIVY